MSGPRDPDGAGWHEPEHLGGGAEAPGPGEEAPRGWTPWRRDAARRDTGGRDTGGRDAGRRQGGTAPDALPPPVIDDADPFGAQAWAVQHGWTVSDGNGPRDAVLADLVASAPVRPGKEARAASVLRGRAGLLELVAFDIAYPAGRRLLPHWAVTAAPMLGAVPALRLSPARFWKHRIGGLLQIPSGDEEFDLRWMLLAPEDSPQARRLVQDPTVRGLLLGSDDGDEFWTAAGHLAAVRSSGHRPALIEHHTRLLTAALGALSIGGEPAP